MPPSSPAGLALTEQSLTGYVPAADGTQLYYYTVGEGSPTIVCCDGIGCDGYVWRYIARDFAPRNRIVRWHYRGHGLSEKSAPSAMTMANLVDDLIRVLDANQVDRGVLLGHSLGVQVILEAHRRHPDRVLALVPMCGAFGRPLDTVSNSFMKRLVPAASKFIERFPRAANAIWKQFDTEFAYQVALVTEVNRELVRRSDFREYFTHLSQMDPRLFVNLLADAAHHDALPHLTKIDVPMLIIAGENDGMTPSWLSAIMQHRVRGADLCTVPKGTHTAPIEMPELVNLRLRRFLDERVAPLMREKNAVDASAA